jgi:predicted RNA-binding Zn-ribbon protein involved in translation (DUF1610 family)
MQSLEEYNKMMLAAYQIKETVATGIACPKCETEMLKNPHAPVLTSMPPRQAITCPNCGNVETIVV